MTVFLIGAALMLAATLTLLLRPLMRTGPLPAIAGRRSELNLAVLREQMRELDAEREAGMIDAAAHAQARDELQRRVVEEVLPQQAAAAGAAASRWPAILVGIAVPVLAAAIYVLVGAPMALAPTPVQQAEHDGGAQQVEAMVAGLASKMKEQPDNPQGWLMLARSYNVLGRYRDAADAYAELVRRVEPDAGLYADYADTLAMAQGQSLQGEPEKLIEKALATDPVNLKALALSGSAAFERGDFARAVYVWEKLVAAAPADSDVAGKTADSIAHAKRLQSERSAAPAR